MTKITKSTPATTNVGEEGGLGNLIHQILKKKPVDPSPVIGEILSALPSDYVLGSATAVTASDLSISMITGTNASAMVVSASPEQASEIRSSVAASALQTSFQIVSPQPRLINMARKFSFNLQNDSKQQAAQMTLLELTESFKERKISHILILDHSNQAVYQFTKVK